MLSQCYIIIATILLLVLFNVIFLYVPFAEIKNDTSGRITTTASAVNELSTNIDGFILRLCNALGTPPGEGACANLPPISP